MISTVKVVYDMKIIKIAKLANIQARNPRLDSPLNIVQK